MPFSKAFSFLLLLQLGRYSSAQSDTACLTRRECNVQRKKLGFSKFFVGRYQTKGCFSKGDVVYYGNGGTKDEKSESALSGGEERIWCAMVPTQTATFENSGDKCIDVQVNTGKLFGDEAGFNLFTKPKNGSRPKKLLDYPAGSLESEREYKKQVCVPEGTYTLTTFGKSSYVARLAKEEVLHGRNSWGKTSSYDIVIGYKPTMNDIEKAWLDEHNSRREEFHKNHNKKYLPLKWSSELAKDASNWVDKMLPTCEIVREPNLNVGESIAIYHYSGSMGPSHNEVPATILTRWVDMKMDKDYPDNQTLTQVMWRASRYVGCANKSELNDDGTYCYVSICRYSRPGNCSMSSDNWLDVTLKDHSHCGKACPGEGCH